jgi:Txe/YoeB family toxin of Txe-Axe toxin-antitoxin module
VRRVFFVSRFENKLKIFHSRHPEFANAVEAAIIASVQDPYTPSLRTHRLNGVLADCFAFRFSREYRIVFALAADRVTFIALAMAASAIAQVPSTLNIPVSSTVYRQRAIPFLARRASRL